MKRNAFAVILVLTILLGFQNCNTSGAGADQASEEILVVAAPQVEKLNFGQLQFKNIQLYSKISKIIQQSGGQYQVKMNQLLDLNLDNGVVSVSNDFEENVQRYCWPQDQLDSLKTLVSELEFCRYTKQLPEDTVCAQVYKLPYARLIATSQDIDLGAYADSCESSTIDVCNEKKQSLLDSIAELQSRHQAYACP